jgi:hypothetical protein
MSAEPLDVEPFHVLIELVRNADDLGASKVRVAVRRSRRQTRLLVAHDGHRVRLHHIIDSTTRASLAKDRHRLVLISAKVGDRFAPKTGLSCRFFSV